MTIIRFILIAFLLKSPGRPVGRIKWQIYLPENSNFRIILIDSYSDSSGRPGGRSSGRHPPKKMAISDSY